MSYFVLQTLFWLLLSFILGLILGRWLKRLLCNRTKPELQGYSTVNESTTNKTTTYSGTADKLAFRDRGEHTTKTNERSHTSTKTAAAGIATAAVAGAVSHSLSSSDDEVKTEDVDVDIDANRVDAVDEIVEIEQFDDITIDTDISHDESITIDAEIATDSDNDADIAKAETRQAVVGSTWEDKNIDETTSTDHTTESTDDDGLLLKSAALGTVGVTASIIISSDEDDDNEEIEEEANTADSEIIEDSTYKTTDIIDEAVEEVIVTKSTISGLDSDNLQIIEGIGPKMQKILHANGIHDWKALSLKSEADLRGMLDQYDDRYKGVENLGSWISQAKLAADGDIDELIRVQKVDGISKVENKFGITGSGKSSSEKAGSSKSVDSKTDAATNANKSASEASSKNIAGFDTTSEKSNTDKSDTSETTSGVSTPTESSNKESIHNETGKETSNGTSSTETSGSNTEASSGNAALTGVAAAITGTATAQGLMGSTDDGDNDNADSSSQTNGVRSQANDSSSKHSGISGIDSDENLQIIEGIGPAMEKVLKENGINNWRDLASKSEMDVQTILDSYGDKYKLMQPASWITEAKLAAAGDVTELIRIQKVDGISKLEKLMGKNAKSGFGRYQQNDLQIVEGIGPKIAGLLNKAGINSWKELANTDINALQDILDAGGEDFQMANPTTWAEQATLADQGNWKELKSYQDFLEGGVAPSSGANVRGLGSADDNASSQANGASSKDSGIPGIDSNENLQIIEGIGPAMEKVLKENGVNNWHDLGSKSETDVQAILNSYGDKYKLMQPASWITEAKLAATGNIAELIRIQKVDGISKLEKLMGANNKSGFAAYQTNDLQIVEGIGPKIADLLNSSGINSWKALAKADEKKLQGILDVAGSSFQIANPSTWAEQAGLADKGKWADLKKYQDFLDGGRDV